MSTNDKLVPGMVLGRYELLLPIAQGGMATVWAARQKGSRGFSKTVAIKTMLPALSDDAQFEQMFLDEAALAARIHHPNVAEILDLGEQDEILYLVMEWIDGEALSVITKAAKKNDTQLPVRVALRVLGQACAGLHAAHELRDDNEVALELVHRDVSPQNILVTYDGVVKLVDFGVAKAVGRAGGETTAGQLKGKVPYMSPEQARGGNVDRRTDVFAMGIVLYKLTTGLHPFMGENDLVTMRNIISRPLLPPRVKNPQFSAELEQVLMKCLQKDPEKRYQSMVELQGALERVRGSMGVAEDDVGGFVRTLMGERGAKRRAALRDAVRVADERESSGRQSVPGPVVHDAVSEIVLTKMTSGVKEEILPDRVSQASGGPTGLVHTSATPSGHPGAQVGPTSQQGTKRGRSGLIAGLALGGVAAAVGLFMVVSGGTGKPIAAANVTAAAMPAPAASSAEVAQAPTASATSSAEPAPTNSVVNVEDLPNAEEKADPAKRRPYMGPARPRPDPKPAATADPKPSRPASTQFVPAVQNPGF